MPRTNGIAPKHPLISRHHVTTLDGLRGVAILMVLGIHFVYAVTLPKPAFIHWIFPFLVSGWMGVDLFFVLSGFLITGILLDTKASPNYFRSFYARRTLCIFPLYYLVLLAILLLAPLLLKSSFFRPLTPSYASWISYFFYVQNWWLPLSGASLTNLIGDYWSLGVEEQFYLIWALVVLVFSSRRLVYVCVFLCILCPLFRLTLLLHNPPAAFILTNTFTRMDTLLWGSLMALVVRCPEFLGRLKPLLNYVVFACLAGLLVIDFGFHELYSRAFYTQSFGFTIIAIGFSALLLKAYIGDSEGGWLATVLRNPILRSFGRYSYGIYVFHSFVLFAIEAEFASRPWFGKSLGRGLGLAALFLLSAYVAAFASYHLYERQFLRMKSRFKAQAVNVTANKIAA